jgi:uncharacterized protein with GYD domain
MRLLKYVRKAIKILENTQKRLHEKFREIKENCGINI